ncbi:MAG TPA: polyphenol oxidase family protein [Acidimicrobiales bacterium]|nr:polyphenol oxidase family protein [Acidimicrobiales bacterium]
MRSLRLGPAEVRFTGREEGDVSQHAGVARGARQRAVVDRPWKTARQVHGSRAVFVDSSTGDVGDADALVTTYRTIAIAVHTADCAPVALAGGDVAAVAHAGWRGLEAGVLDETVELMRAKGATAIEAALGPCIQPSCYEFGADDLERLVDRFGDSVRSTTSEGTPALDVPAAVRTSLERLDVVLVHDVGTCTACEPDEWFSHRARQEPERQATVVWLP